MKCIFVLFDPEMKQFLHYLSFAIAHQCIRGSDFQADNQTVLTPVLDKFPCIFLGVHVTIKLQVFG